MSGQASGKQTPRDPPWSLRIAIAEIPEEEGRRVDLVADVRAREAVAKLALVLSLPRLKAAFELTRQGRDGVRVVGSISATVEQNCVVTLEPMQSEIEEAIDLVFLPPSPSAKEQAAPDEPEEMGEDFEPLRDGVVDLGAVATEFLILGINPYPRKPGAVFEAPKLAEDPAERPFAALAALKKDAAGRDS